MKSKREKGESFMYQLSYYGVSAFHIGLSDGRGILLDPYLDFGPVAPQHLPRVDLITISHGATDNIGSAFEVAKARDCTVFAPPAVVEYAMMQGVSQERLFVMAQGAERELADVRVKAVAACHVSFIRAGSGRYLTDCPLGYIITLPDGLKVYHMGDTAIFGDLKLFGELYQPDVVLLPIGKFKGAITEMDPEEAALAACWLGAKRIIPMHYDPDTQPDHPDRLIRALAGRGCPAKVTVMKPGDTVHL